MLQETTIKANETNTANYVYGTERIEVYSSGTKVSYVYDGRISVAQTVTANFAGNTTNLANNPPQGATIKPYMYTPFGEPQHTKASGFMYNAEAFDAAIGVLNLRARQYEPLMNRFRKKDILKGRTIIPLSLNSYGYCVNSPIMFVDPNGTDAGSLFEGIWNSFKGLGSATVETIHNTYYGLRNNADKMLQHPSPENIINWLTFGTVDQTKVHIQKNQQNYQNAIENPSIKTWSNYALGGIPDEIIQTISMALDPSNPTVQWKAALRLGCQLTITYKLGQLGFEKSPTTKSIIKLADVRGAVSGTVSKDTFDNAFTNYISKDKAKLTPKQIGVKGETALVEMVGGTSQKYFNTIYGRRFIDQWADNITHESKVGYTTLNSRIKQQILKDRWLVNNGKIKESV